MRCFFSNIKYVWLLVSVTPTSGNQEEEDRTEASHMSLSFSPFLHKSKRQLSHSLAFRVGTICNELSDDGCSAASVASFRLKLKSCLFFGLFTINCYSPGCSGVTTICYAYGLMNFPIQLMIIVTP